MYKGRRGEGVVSAGENGRHVPNYFHSYFPKGNSINVTSALKSFSDVFTSQIMLKLHNTERKFLHNLSCAYLSD